MLTKIAAKVRSIVVRSRDMSDEMLKLEDRRSEQIEDLFATSRSSTDFDVGSAALAEKRERDEKQLAKVNKARKSRGQKPLLSL